MNNLNDQNLFEHNLNTHIRPFIEQKAKEQQRQRKYHGLYLSWNAGLNDSEVEKTLLIAYDREFTTTVRDLSAKNRQLLKKNKKPIDVLKKDGQEVTAITKGAMTFRNYDTLVKCIHARFAKPDANLYEVIIGTGWSRPFADIDGPLPDFLRDASHELQWEHGLKVVAGVERVLTAFLGAIFGEEPTPEMFRFAMHTHNKISIHVIVVGFGAIQVAPLKAVWDGGLLDALVAKLWPTFNEDLGPTAKVHSVFDSLWKSMTQFRLPFNIKLGGHQSSMLVPIGNYPILTDYMATYIHSERQRVPGDLARQELWPGICSKSLKRPRRNRDAASVHGLTNASFIDPSDSNVPECVVFAAKAVLYTHLWDKHNFDTDKVVGGLDLVPGDKSFWDIVKAMDNDVGIPCLQCSAEDGLSLGGIRVHEHDRASVTIRRVGDVCFCCPRHAGSPQVNLGNIKWLAIEKGHECPLLLQAGHYLQTGLLLEIDSNTDVQNGDEDGDLEHRDQRRRLQTPTTE